MTTNIEKSVEVDLNLSDVYALWTNFEKFPDFMMGVESVKFTDPDLLHWEASVLGVKREWDAKVTENIINEKIAWESVTGTTNNGSVQFQELNPERTLVTLHLHFEPEGFIEKLGDKTGLAGDLAEGDLERFRKHVEELVEQAKAPSQEALLQRDNRNSEEVAFVEETIYTELSPEDRERVTKRPEDDILNNPTREGNVAEERPEDDILNESTVIGTTTIEEEPEKERINKATVL